MRFAPARDEQPRGRGIRVREIRQAGARKRFELPLADHCADDASNREASDFLADFHLLRVAEPSEMEDGLGLEAKQGLRGVELLPHGGIVFVAYDDCRHDEMLR